MTKPSFLTDLTVSVAKFEGADGPIRRVAGYPFRDSANPAQMEEFRQILRKVERGLKRQPHIGQRPRKERRDNLSKPKSLPPIPPPDPMELAKLAAVLQPKHAAQRGLRQAMELYLEAVLFCDGLPSDAKRVWAECVSDERKMARVRESWEDLGRDLTEDTVTLDPNEGEDEARQYFNQIAQQEGLAGPLLKKARSVRENLERYFERTRKDAGPDRMSGREVLEKFKRKENGRTTYHIPKILIESLVQFKGEARRESNRKGAKTKEIARAKNPNTKAVKTRQQKSSV